MGSPISDDGYGTGALSSDSGREEGPYLSDFSEARVEWDPYLAASPPNETWMESAGAGGDPSPVQPPSSNASWAEFSEPGQLGIGMMRGVVNGVVPNGMELFFKSIKHNASTDAFTRRQGLFPLPVDVAGWDERQSDQGGQSREISAWTNLICLALNKMAGWTTEVRRQPWL